MRRNLKERYSRRSFLFIMVMIIGFNMFLFVNGALSYFFMIGQFWLITLTVLTLFILIMIPYTYKIMKLKFGATRLDDTLKDDLFFLSFGYAYTIVGLIIIIMYIITSW